MAVISRAYKYGKALYLAKKSRNKPVQNGIPLSSKISRDSKGRIDKYSTYDSKGMLRKEVRLTGKSHGGIPRPNVKYPKYNYNKKTKQKFHNGYGVRKAKRWEIPRRR